MKLKNSKVFLLSEEQINNVLINKGCRLYSFFWVTTERMRKCLIPKLIKGKIKKIKNYQSKRTGKGKM